MSLALPLTVSRKYLPLYVAEFEFRYNNRRNADNIRDRNSGLLTEWEIGADLAKKNAAPVRSANG